jgi:hypothetical protein
MSSPPTGRRRPDNRSPRQYRDLGRAGPDANDPACVQIPDRQAGSNTGGESLIDPKDVRIDDRLTNWTIAQRSSWWRPLGTATSQSHFPQPPLYSGFCEKGRQHGFEQPEFLTTPLDNGLYSWNLRGIRPRPISASSPTTRFSRFPFGL